MKLSKIFIIIIISLLFIGTLTAISNAASGVIELDNYLNASHTICGKSYSLNSAEKQKVTAFIKENSISDSAASNALSKLKQAESALNNSGASNTSSVPANVRTQAISLIQQAGSDVGLNIKINTDANTVSIVDAKKNSTIATATYITDSTGNVVFTSKLSNTSSSSSSSSSSTTSTSKSTISVLEGKNQEYNINSGKDLVFRFDVEYTVFKNGGKIYLDNKELDSTKYTTKSGSTIVSINSDYAKTLSKGSHTIQLALADGKKADSSFTVTDGTTTATNTTNTTNTTAGSTNTANQAKTFAYTGRDNLISTIMFLLSVVAVSTVFVKKVYGK